MPDRDPSDLIQLTTDIVSAFVVKNPVSSDGLPDLIRSVHDTLADIAAPGPAAGEPPEPAVPVSKSITPDYLICLEDGRQLKMLKRYLRSRYAMTPDEYRARWNLPPNYPMVAPNYAKRRSEFAKEIGLGRKSG